MELLLPNIVLILLCNAQYSTSSIPDDESLRALSFKSDPGHMVVISSDIENATKMTTKVNDSMDCVFTCVGTLWCRSVNFKNTPEGDGLHVCELLSVDKFNILMYLKQNESITYFSTKNPCETVSCLNEGKCISPNREEHECKCKGGYEGDVCQTNIDECATNTHNCSVNATCTDTEGSFSCSCKTGHTGDGTVCSEVPQPDNSISNSVILQYHNNPSFSQTLSTYLSPVLQDPNKSRWIRCWHAASDGWDVTTTFHPQCDNKGPTVTIVRVGSYVFGGYSDISWSNSVSGYATAPKALLFSLYNTNGLQPVKLGPKTGNTAKIYRNSIYGPAFGGGHDLKIHNLASSGTDSYTYVHTYKNPPGCSSSGYCSVYTGVSGRFAISDIEVFYETTT